MTDAEYRTEIHAAIRRALTSYHGRDPGRTLVRAIADQVLAVTRTEDAE